MIQSENGFDRKQGIADNCNMPSTAPKARKSTRSTLKQRLEKAGPSNAKLKQLAKTRRPPQRWYDETVDPFKPARK